MDSLLSVDDYTAATGLAVSAVALSMASDVVRAYCGWSLSQESVITTLDSDGGPFLWLPSLLVTDVSSLVVNGVDTVGNPYPALVPMVDWDWRGNGRLSWSRDTYGWPTGGRRVTVSYTSGYPVLGIPGALSAVVMSVVERIVAPSAEHQVLENVGGIQTNLTYSTNTDSNGLTAMEMAVLDRYRIGTIQ